MNAVAEGLRIQVETSRARLADGAGDLPESVTSLWRECLKAIDAAVKAIEPARVKVHKLWARQELTLPAKHEQSTALVRALDDTVRVQLNKAESLLSEIVYKLEEDVRPARPADASEMAVWHRKEEVAAYLRRAASVEAVAQLMGEAIRDHDDLTGYVIGSGPLDWVYRELGLDRRRLRSALFKTVREAKAIAVAGEGLLQAYEAPITDPNSGREDPTCWQALRRDIESMVGTVAGDAANGMRLTAMYSPGWGVPANGEPRRVEQPGTPLEGTPMRAPEFENLQRRHTYFHGNDPTPTRASAVPPDLQPSLDINAVYTAKEK